MGNETVLYELLDDVKDLLATDYEERFKRFKQGKDFNIFEVQGTLKDEVKICRLLRELLDPEGSHGQGSLFLKLFMQEVIQDGIFKETAYKEATVTKEELTQNFRRVDLIIRIDGKLYPIEVKIRAEDQKDQCYDYYEYAKKQDPQAIIYYLTLDGHEPSDSSKKFLKKDEYKCISFDGDIINWITQCINLMELKQIHPVCEILNQFRDTIKILTGNERGGISMEIEEKINMSKEYFSAALEISKTLPYVKAGKMIKVFDAIRAYMKKKGYEECESTYMSEALKYYNQHQVCPCLTYKVPMSDEVLSEKIALRFQIDGYGASDFLYFGIVPWDGENKVKKQEDIADYVKRHLRPIKDVKDDSVDWYWYMCIAEKVRFKHCSEMNENYMKLYDVPDGFNKIMEKVFDNIDEFIQKIH